MSVTIALVPIVSLSALALLYLVLSGLRSARAGELKREHEHFTQNVVAQDAALQQSLLGELLEGRSPAECLGTFERARAALLPGARLEDEAGWDAEELADFARKRFTERLSEVNRKLGIGALTATVVIVAACLVLSAVLYNFQPGAAPAGADAAPAAGSPADVPAPDPFVAPQGDDVGCAGSATPDVPRPTAKDPAGAHGGAADANHCPSTTQTKGPST
jgi:hypothetical protein